MNDRLTSSKVYLVGAGPGPADLLTMRAAKLLAQADVVLFDALITDEVLDLAPRAVKLPVGKRCGRHSMSQAAINLLLIDVALSFSKVVRLKGGDPAVFGRLSEEVQTLQMAGIAYEVVPGITTALAAAAELGVSLTERGVARSVTLSTPALGLGEDAGSDWADIDPRSTLALYMAGGEFGACARRLTSQGWDSDTPVIAMRNVGSSSASQVWCGTLAQAPSRIAGPVVVLIGKALRYATARHANLQMPELANKFTNLSTNLKAEAPSRYHAQDTSSSKLSPAHENLPLPQCQRTRVFT